MYKRILVPTDGNECAKRAEDEAIRLAKATGGKVTFLHVLVSPSTLIPLPTLPDDLDYTLAKTFEKIADEALEAALKKAKEAGVEARATLRRGDDVAYEILEEAVGYDVIVMAPRRRSFKKWLLGSVTQAVLDRSPVPVLVVGCGGLE